jgi:hypothetical protein
MAVVQLETKNRMETQMEVPRMMHHRIESKRTHKKTQLKSFRRAKKKTRRRRMTE